MEELIQYIIVNKDLEMSQGKLAAQVGHACTYSTLYYCTMEDNPNFWGWFDKDQKKIVLRAHEKDIRKLINKFEEEKKLYFKVIDNGLTEIPPQSLTCISLGVLTRAAAEPYIKRFQLL